MFKHKLFKEKHLFLGLRIYLIASRIPPGQGCWDTGCIGLEGGWIGDAKFDVTAQCGLTNEQPRGKREERCEVRSAK